MQQGLANNIPVILKRYKEEHEITQAELAKQAGIDAGHLSRIIRGEQACSFVLLDKLYQNLGFTPNQLLGVESVVIQEEAGA